MMCRRISAHFGPKLGRIGDIALEEEEDEEEDEDEEDEEDPLLALLALGFVSVDCFFLEGAASGAGAAWTA